MTKRQLIEEITHLNPTATPAFLAGFGDDDLAEYLQHLRWVSRPQQPPDQQQFRGPRSQPAEEVALAEQDVAEMSGPAEPAADEQDKAALPFAETDSMEDSPTWLF